MKKIKCIDFFAGSKSFSNYVNNNGGYCLSTDYIDYGGIDYIIDILKFDYKKIDFIPDILWLSPPCTTFSVASIGYHWTGGIGKYKPKTKESKIGLIILEKSIEIIGYYQKKNPNLKWYIENPRGIMRKIIDPLFEKYGIIRKRNTITYCQYGDNRMKPTDIWNNDLNWTGKKICKNGDNCHISSPRGSKNGTQGLKNAFERSKIPINLFKEILGN